MENNNSGAVLLPHYNYHEEENIIKIQSTTTEATTFTIYSQKLAGYLMQKGFILIDMQEDIKPTGRNVFLFKNTPQLQLAIDEYISR